jgi:L-ascorbate metabolism protein UlaG (beta-lactamase superfamily)/nitrite reductase/ring-hydroxylating ferredoxin subunit
MGLGGVATTASTGGEGLGEGLEVCSLGHAGLRLEGSGLRMLMDPWLSRGGAFLGAWHQLPSNDHLDTVGLLGVDWVTVSHEHLDHMDLGLLRRLPPTARVLINRYPSGNFHRRLLEGGVANVVEVDPWRRFALNTGGDWLMFIPELSPMCHDAGVLVCAGGVSVLHCNDARLTVGQCRRVAVEAGGELDVMLVQMSGASWHPIRYQYPPEVLARISAQKRVGKFKSVTRLVRGVRPHLAVPFAGPPCFLDPVLWDNNRHIAEPGIFPSLDQAVGWLAEHLPGQPVMRWLPGDRYQVHGRGRGGGGRLVPDPRWEGFSFGLPALQGWLEGYAADRAGEVAAAYREYPEPDDDGGLGERFAEHFARLGELSGYFLERIAMLVRFEVQGPGGGCWDVELGPDKVRVDLSGRASGSAGGGGSGSSSGGGGGGGGGGGVQYRFRVASRWLAPVIDGVIGWEDLLLSLRFTAWRSPDVYNDYLVGLLKHADAQALRAVERYETGRDTTETITVQGPSGRYQVGRWCPHAGEDLSVGAVIEGGVLRCLGHNFDFDLDTGTCQNARCDPLPTRRLGPVGAGTGTTQEVGE